MAKSKVCPSCRSQVDADELHCPNCPYSFKEEEGVTAAEDRKGRSKEPFFWVIVVALGVFAAWRVLNFVMTYADNDQDKSNPITRLAERAANDASTATAAGVRARTGEGAAQTEEEQTAEAIRRATASGRVTIVRPDGRPAPGAGEGTAAPSPSDDDSASAGDDGGVVIAHSSKERSEPPAKEWRLRGYVYDLVTLKPVSHATLVLKDAELNRRFELVTGSDGRYRTVVPSLPGRGYSVQVQHPDYAVTYLNPGVEDVRDKGEQERREMAQELTHALDAPYTVQGLGKTPVVTDFYLAPLRQN